MAGIGGHQHATEIDWSQPLDNLIYLHFVFQATVWGVIYPLGLVFGLARSRFHVPFQVTGTVLTLAGYFFGVNHGGRQFPETFHHNFGVTVFTLLSCQVALGVYLKAHVHEGTRLRRGAVMIHGVIGKAFPVLGWTQGLLGYVSLMGFCRGGHLGQCLAHYIMGSSFIAYGIILSIMLYFGAAWLERKNISQEYLDSWVICVWGIVNTFTEHDFLEKSGGWSVKDMQHSSMGVIWWAGGALGIFLGRNRKRNFVPSAILILTGWAMSSHAQAMMLSTEVHKAFGEALMGAGLARLIEICFVLKGKHSLHELDPSVDEGAIHPWQHLPPFLLICSGLTFMSATDEELHFLMDLGMDHVTYILLLLSGAFVIYLWTLLLIKTYIICTSPSSSETSTSSNPLSFLWRRNNSNRYKYEAVPDAPGERLGRREGRVRLDDLDSVELQRTNVDRESPNHVLFDERDEREFD
ncbi:hypothetical protein BT69DRAFT_1237032 [Atractiella rhizophila]|nr:hypothetical protein BT69DRAFT_1237032 [Atractiella rhizophila]